METTLTLLIVTVESVVANHLQLSRCSKSCNIFCIYYNHFHHLTCMPYKCLAHFIWKPTISRNDGIHPQRHEYLYYTPCVNNIIPYNHLNGETFCCAVRKIRQKQPTLSFQISQIKYHFHHLISMTNQTHCYMIIKTLTFSFIWLSILNNRVITLWNSELRIWASPLLP